ncbi:MAG: hypothetical protein K8R23_06095 [Chthoniobacter sp.]|nr:hypothetical protein [Chthoniobacter sp.]
MKLILPLLAIAVFLTSCSTEAPRRRHWQQPASYSYAPETAHYEDRPMKAPRGASRKVWAEGEEVHDWHSAPRRFSYDQNTTHRDLYSPSQGSGPYSRALREGTWRSPKSAAEQMEEMRRAEKLRELQGTAKPPSGLAE